MLAPAPQLRPSLPAPARRPLDPVVAQHASVAISLAARQGRLLLEVLDLVIGGTAYRRTLSLLLSVGLRVEVEPDEFVLTTSARPPPDEV